MSLERVRPGRYIAPSGSVHEFDFKDLREKVRKRTTPFSFANVDGQYIQDRGHDARRYPMRCFLSGEDHDLAAEAFIGALLERGPGRLEHPLYGNKDVVPFGEIDRRDDLVESVDQTILDVAFWNTIGLVYPSSQLDPRAQLLAELDALDQASAAQFGDATDLSTAVGRENVKAKIREILGAVEAQVGALAAENAEINRQYRDRQSAIVGGLDVLIRQPLTLALQIADTTKEPARALGSIETRLRSYQALGSAVRDSVTPSTATSATLARQRINASNGFHAADLFATSATAGAMVSVVEHEFATKPEALRAAESILEQFEATVEWRDQAYRDLGQLDPGGSYQALRDAVAFAAGFLVEISFQVVPERRITLDRDRTIIDLAAEIYGSVDDRLDQLIANNDLTGSEILELKRGRSILFYP